MNFDCPKQIILLALFVFNLYIPSKEFLFKQLHICKIAVNVKGALFWWRQQWRSLQLSVANGPLAIPRDLHIHTHQDIYISLHIQPSIEVSWGKEKKLVFIHVCYSKAISSNIYAMISQKGLVLLADLKRFSIYLSLLWMQRSRQRFVLINPFLHISNPLNMQRPMKTSPAESHLVFFTQTSIPWKLIVSPIPYYIWNIPERYFRWN